MQGGNTQSLENSELVEVNRGLSSTLEKLEQHCKTLEGKVAKLKEYKKIFKSSAALQCSSCSKFLNSNIFLHHLSTCQQSPAIKQHASASSHPTSPFMSGSSSSSTTVIDVNLLFITINQTMVRESPDSRVRVTPYPSSLMFFLPQPYTEYLIQVSYHTKKWEVARKYKNFCELH